MRSTLGATVFAGLMGAPVLASPPTADDNGNKLWQGYPRQNLKLVAEVVGAAHFDEKRVKELVTTYPELVNACWDWGFGDWETPLGAAAHTGQREIAEFLLAHGARIDIFAAAMLGHTDVVKAFVAAQPGIQRSLGPHGLSLLAHARAREKSAADTVAYLEKLGDAEGGLKPVALETKDKQKYLGTFAADALGLTFVCRLNRAELLVVDVQTSENQSNGRLIHSLGSDEFFPAGVPSVRIQFAFEKGKEKASALTLRGTVPEVTLQRRGD
jgi:hypothetical protein